MQQVQHTSETFEKLKMYICNIEGESLTRGAPWPPGWEKLGRQGERERASPGVGRASSRSEWGRAADSPATPSRHLEGSRSCFMDLAGVGERATGSAGVGASGGEGASPGGGRRCRGGARRGSGGGASQRLPD